MYKETITTFTKLSCTLWDVRSLFRYGRASMLPWLTMNINLQQQPKENDLTNGTIHWKKPFVWADCCAWWWHASRMISNPHTRKIPCCLILKFCIHSTNIWFHLTIPSIQPFHKVTFTLSEKSKSSKQSPSNNVLKEIKHQFLIYFPSDSNASRIICLSLMGK